MTVVYCIQVIEIMFKQEKLKPLNHKKIVNSNDPILKSPLLMGNQKAELKKSPASPSKPTTKKPSSEEGVKPMKLQRSSTRSTKIV